MDYFESPANELLDLDLDDFRQVMAINLDGTLLLLKLWAHMVEAGKFHMLLQDILMLAQFRMCLVNLQCGCLPRSFRGCWRHQGSE